MLEKEIVTHGGPGCERSSPRDHTPVIPERNGRMVMHSQPLEKGNTTNFFVAFCRYSYRSPSLAPAFDLTLLVHIDG